MMKEKFSSQYPLTKIYNFLIAKLWESRESDHLTQSLYYEMALCLKEELYKEKMILHPEEKNLIEEKLFRRLELSSDEIDGFEWIGFLFLPVFSKEEKIARGESILKSLLGEEHEIMSILINNFKKNKGNSLLNREYLLALSSGVYLYDLELESIQSRIKHLNINLEIVLKQIITIIDLSFTGSENIYHGLNDISKDVDQYSSKNTQQVNFDTPINASFGLIHEINMYMESYVIGYIKLLKVLPNNKGLDISILYSIFLDFFGKIQQLINGDKERICYFNKSKIYSLQKILDQIDDILMQKKAESSEKIKEKILELKNSQKRLIQFHNEIVEIAKSVYGFNFSRIEENEI